MTVELAPHQILAVKKMHNGCILKGGVGVGKSITALSYYYERVAKGTPPGPNFKRMANPVDVYVITTAKKRESLEWEGEAAPFGIGTEPNNQGVRIVIDSWNNIVKYKDVTNAFFIFDEQRLVGSGAWVKAFLTIAKANQWVILSATPGDVWLDYIPAFVANGFYRNRTEFLRRHAVYSYFGTFPRLERYVDTGHLEDLRRRILVDMPYARHTVRHTKHIMVAHDKEQFRRVFTDRWHIYEDRPIKDVSELYALMRKLVNSDVSRIAALMELSETHPRMIVFYNFNYELDILRALMGTLDMPYAEWNGQKHQDLPTGDRWIYLVQYTAGAEGWNCITTDTVVFWSLNYSYRITEQAKGRIDRLNTPYVDLYYYHMRSASYIDQQVMKALVEKREFNEKKDVALAA